MSLAIDVDNAQQVDNLISAVASIAHGDVSGPGGLESVAMAIAGTLDGQVGIGDALLAVAEAINNVADALEHARVDAIGALDRVQVVNRHG